MIGLLNVCEVDERTPYVPQTAESLRVLRLSILSGIWGWGGVRQRND